MAGQAEHTELSNGWKKECQIFQWLELFQENFPMLGNPNLPKE